MTENLKRHPNLVKPPVRESLVSQFSEPHSLLWHLKGILESHGLERKAEFFSAEAIKACMSSGVPGMKQHERRKACIEAVVSVAKKYFVFS